MAYVARGTPHKVGRWTHITTAVSCLLLGLLAGYRRGCHQTALLHPLPVSGTTANSTTSSSASSSASSEGTAAEALWLAAQLEESRAERDAAQEHLARLQAKLVEAAAADVSVSTLPGPTNPHTPWQPSLERDQQHSELAAFLREVAINGEVMVAVSNSNIAQPGGMLQLWAENALLAGVRNLMVVALDNDTRSRAESYGVRALYMDVEMPATRKASGSNHGTSSLKFGILKRFLQLGYAVLLSDVDIVYLQNPFDHLTRDSDVEGSTDGWDNVSAYGNGNAFAFPCTNI